MSAKPAPRIALIHATALAMDPVKGAIERHWPEVEAVNLLDDSLAVDRAKNAELTDAMSGRILALARYARDLRAEGVLFTCSAFGGAIEAAADAAAAPVLKPNEAMFAEAIAFVGPVVLLYTFAPAGEGMMREFRDLAAASGSQAEIQPVFVEGAIEALRGGDAETHNTLVARAAARHGDVAAIMLAHFSTSRARQAALAATDAPVLTAPDAAVTALRRRIQGG